MKIRILTYLLLALLFVACSSGGEEIAVVPDTPVPTDSVPSDKPQEPGGNEESGGEELPPVDYDDSKDHQIVFSWNKNAEVGIYTLGNSRIFCTVQEVHADAHAVTLTCNGWGINPQTQYYAYYPYSSYYFEHSSLMTALPITFTGQTQRQNRSMSHLAAYDYMTAQAVTGDADACFDFQHLCSILKLVCVMPQKDTLTCIMLTTDDATAFAMEATMDVTSNSITSTQTNDTISLALDNVGVEAQDSLVAYLMMAPTDLTDKTITVTLTNHDGKMARTELVGCKMLAGKTYPVVVKNIAFEGSGAKSIVRTASSKGKGEDLSNTGATRAAVAITQPKAIAKDFDVDKDNRFKEQNKEGEKE